MFRGQAKIEKSRCRIQNNAISEETILRPRMSETEKEYVPNVSEDKNEINERKGMNEDKCFKPKKCVSIIFF